ncbi:hypothetical protein B2J93_393 [Marssonina coronariae]|uniref:Uncharacterized protein n=1 Tax=Diplocarpon coronariae TaxID=2795749 RepID=A0A218Z911_9HELO|nr:hypothetical protein B2J93_393 [Marssonina coronariae]
MDLPPPRISLLLLLGPPADRVGAARRRSALAMRGIRCAAVRRRALFPLQSDAGAYQPHAHPAPAPPHPGPIFSSATPIGRQPEGIHHHDSQACRRREDDDDEEEEREGKANPNRSSPRLLRAARRLQPLGIPSTFNLQAPEAEAPSRRTDANPNPHRPVALASPPTPTPTPTPTQIRIRIPSTVSRPFPLPSTALPPPFHRPSTALSPPLFHLARTALPLLLSGSSSPLSS